MAATNSTLTQVKLSDLPVAAPLTGDELLEVTQSGATRSITVADLAQVGKSAFEIALDRGFEGTEAHWLDSLRGDQGLQGPQGIQGLQGAQGLRGLAGAEGTPGLPGADGLQGHEGPQGNTGPRGELGPVGPAGATAYQLARQSGFPGDLTAWTLSLRGETGATGDPGPRGLQGEAGPRGAAGTPGEAGPTGPQGLIGSPGPQGVAGQQGPVGQNGAKGDPGSMGATGARGEAGARGETGSQGSRGEQGLQGIQGATGERGERGVRGETGVPARLLGSLSTQADLPTASVSSEGDVYMIEGSLYSFTDRQWRNFGYVRGTPGAQGLTGAKGDVGPQGVQGLRGLPGPDPVSSPAGLVGDNATDNYASLQAAVTAGRRGYRIPSGEFRFNTALVADYSVVGFPVVGASSARQDLHGDSLSNTILNYGGVGYAIALLGADQVGAPGARSLDRVGGFTLQDASKARTNRGLLLQNKAQWQLSDIALECLDVGLSLQSVYRGSAERIYASQCGVAVELSALSATQAPSHVLLSHLYALNCTRAAVVGTGLGSNVTLRGVVAEGCGLQGNTTSGGVFLSVHSELASGILTIEDGVFSGNRGQGDVVIDNASAKPLMVTVRGCQFTRNAASAYTQSNLVVTSSGGGQVKVRLEGNTFQSSGDYAPAPLRPFFRGTAGKVEFVDVGGNLFSETVSLVSAFASGPNASGLIAADGSLVRGQVIVAKKGVGLYQVTGLYGFGKNETFYVAAAVSNDPTGQVQVSRVVQVSGATFEVTTTTPAGVYTDAAFSFTVVKLGGA